MSEVPLYMYLNFEYCTLEPLDYITCPIRPPTCADLIPQVNSADYHRAQSRKCFRQKQTGNTASLFPGNGNRRGLCFVVSPTAGQHPDPAPQPGLAPLGRADASLPLGEGQVSSPLGRGAVSSPLGRGVR
jgi:hypothetical protein